MDTYLKKAKNISLINLNQWLGQVKLEMVEISMTRLKVTVCDFSIIYSNAYLRSDKDRHNGLFIQVND